MSFLGFWRKGMLSLAAAVVFYFACHAQDPSKKADAGGGDAVQPAKNDIPALVAEFSATATADDRRRKIADELLGKGAEGALALEKAAQSLIKKRTAAYLPEYDKALKALCGKSLKSYSMVQSEVKSLQLKMKNLRAEKNLTKEMVVEQGDPAMEKLAKLLYVSPAEVLSSNKDLSDARSGITGLSTILSRCQDMTAKPPAKKGDDVPDTRSPTLDEELARLELLASVKIMANRMALKKDFSVLDSNEKITPKIDSYEAIGILDLNRMRIFVGSPVLSIDTKLCDAGRGHSNDMRTKNFFEHESPVPGKKTPWDRAKKAGTTANGENIAYGQQTPEEVNMSWFHSPGHHKNMLNPEFGVMGLGRSYTHWTQMFRDAGK